MEDALSKHIPTSSYTYRAACEFLVDIATFFQRLGAASVGFGQFGIGFDHNSIGFSKAWLGNQDPVLTAMNYFLGMSNLLVCEKLRELNLN